MSSKVPSQMVPPASGLLQTLEARVREEGFEHFGFAELQTPLTIDLYDQWIAKGFHGEMEWLERHADDKRNPNKFFKRAKTAIVVTQDYIPHPDPKIGWPLSDSSRVAAYARGRDYHRFFHHKLRKIIAKLELDFPDEQFYSFTDAGPVLERDLAARAGLGWVGKNTCILNRERGSFFLLGEIYTSLDLPIAKFQTEDLEKDFCGTCTRCIDACPTGAIVKEREVDARKCISYLTIESKHNAPSPLREQIGDWLFGCDICQVVCPWNIKAKGKDVIDALTPKPDDHTDLIKDLNYLLTAPNRQLERDFEATPLARINGMGLKRNALVVAGNLKLEALREAISRHVNHERLGEPATWALKCLDEAKNFPSKVD